MPGVRPMETIVQSFPHGQTVTKCKTFLHKYLAYIPKLLYDETDDLHLLYIYICYISGDESGV